MMLKICIDNSCIEYEVDDAYRADALQVLDLVRRGKYVSAGMHIHKLLKHAKLM